MNANALMEDSAESHAAEPDRTGSKKNWTPDERLMDEEPFYGEAAGAGEASLEEESALDLKTPVDDLPGLLECILFLSKQTVRFGAVAKRFDVDEEAFARAIEALREKYATGGLELVAVAGGYEMAVRREFAEPVRRHFNQPSGARLTRATLEALSIIAYRQPVARAEIEGLRGVASGHLLHALLDRGLIKVVGRAPGAGRALLYGTTGEFLRYMGLQSLDDLPPLEDMSVGL